MSHALMLIHTMGGAQKTSDTVHRLLHHGREKVMHTVMKQKLLLVWKIHTCLCCKLHHSAYATSTECTPSAYLTTTISVLV